MSLPSCQSRTAVIFAIRSPQPLASNLLGAFFITSTSTKTPSGAVATKECGLSPLTETKGLAMPSCEADVGMLTNDLSILKPIILAISTERPPPIPITKSLLFRSTFFSISIIDFLSIVLAKCQMYLILDVLRDFSIFF